MASPNPDFGEIVTTTLKNRRRQLADNITNHNALLRRLNERGSIQLEDGGETLVEELEYAENSTFKYYSGFEVLDISPSDVFTAAEFDWKQAATTVVIDGLTQRKNAGRNQMINLLERRIANAEKTLMNQISTGIYSDGTGSNGKEIGGLQLLVADDPTVGTVGGIDRASFSFWRNFSFDATTDGGGAVTSTNVQGMMDEIWVNLVRGSDHPDLIVADSTFFRAFWESLQAIQRIASDSDASSGFRSLSYNGPGGQADVMFDDAIPANKMYFLNTDNLHWRVHRDANFEPLTKVDSINQDAIVRRIIFMGNLTMSNASLQGVLKD